MKVGSAALIGLLLLGTACRGRSCGKTPSARELALAEAGLEVLTAEQANDRVSRVFPRGVASENARAEIGEAPAPPVVVGPEADSSFIATIELREDATKPAKIAAALGSVKEAKGASVRPGARRSLGRMGVRLARAEDRALRSPRRRRGPRTRRRQAPPRPQRRGARGACGVRQASCRIGRQGRALVLSDAGASREASSRRRVSAHGGRRQ